MRYWTRLASVALVAALTMSPGAIADVLDEDPPPEPTEPKDADASETPGGFGCTVTRFVPTCTFVCLPLDRLTVYATGSGGAAIGANCGSLEVFCSTRSSDICFETSPPGLLAGVGRCELIRGDFGACYAHGPVSGPITGDLIEGGGG